MPTFSRREGKMQFNINVIYFLLIKLSTKYGIYNINNVIILYYIILFYFGRNNYM